MGLSWPARLALLLLPLLAAPAAQCAEEYRQEKYLQVFVTEPYLELHTAPGRGYPVFHTVPRDESVDVLKRRTDWYKVRTEHGVEGWAKQREMLKTVLADGSPFTVELGNLTGFTTHRWESGVFFYGDYGGASLVSAYGARSLNQNLKLELSIGQFLGDSSNGLTADLGLTHVFLPERRFSPFAMLGTGIINIDPKATLVLPDDRTDQTAYVGGGIRFYLTRRFFLRGEYKSHMVFTSRNDNDKVDEWKLGFAFFF
jgi:hypothetical protein